MSGFLWGILGIAGGFGLAAIGDMVSEEVRDRLDQMPHGLLRVAAKRLSPDQHGAVCADEWLAELTYILKGDEARPISRLYHGVRFAFGVLLAVRRITCQLNRVSPLHRALISIGTAIVNAKLLVTEIYACEQNAEAIVAALSLPYSRFQADRVVFTRMRLRRRLRKTRSRLDTLYRQRDIIEGNIIKGNMGSSLNEVLSRVESYAPEDWAYVLRMLGNRNKNRYIHRISGNRDFLANFLSAVSRGRQRS